MANQALAVLESALRDRKLDRTLTTALAPLERTDGAAQVPFGIDALDGRCAAACRVDSSRNWPARRHQAG